NDPSRPTATVALSGSALAPPIAGVAPPSLHIVAPQGGHQSATLTLSNTGGSGLTFSVESSIPTPALHSAAPAPENIHVAPKLPASAVTRAVAARSTPSPLATPPATPALL